MKRILAVVSIVICVGLAWLVVTALSESQRADNGWDPKVSRPTYTTDHPRVILDEAHYNAHTAGGKYRPFVRLLEADGYQVLRGKEKFTHESLADARVLVIVNASGAPKPEILGINIPFPDQEEAGDARLHVRRDSGRPLLGGARRISPADC